MSQIYRLTVENKSSFSGQIIIYQEAPKTNLSSSDLFSLAWLSEGIEGSSGGSVNTADFEWTLDYGFVWSRKGQLREGVKFTAAGSANVESLDPPNRNHISFKKGNQNYTFGEITNGRKGRIEIHMEESVVQDEASVGVSMSGAGTFAIVARPRFDAWFEPHPNYIVALGSYQKGEVMDLTQLSGMYKLQFKPGKTEVTLTYGSDGVWTQK